MDSIRECPHCGKACQEGSKFCPSCGSPLTSKDGGRGEAPRPDSSQPAVVPQGRGLAKAITTITSPEQKRRYIFTGLVLSAFGFFVASIPLGTATLVVGRILLKNQIRNWGYLFCIVGTIWAVGIPLINFISLFKTASISIIPSLPKF